MSETKESEPAKAPGNPQDMTRRSSKESSAEQQLIIDQPFLQKPFTRGMQVLVSVSAWVIFLYFFQTLLTAILWIVGGELLYHKILIPESVEGTKQLLLATLYFAILAFLVLFGWANWNYWRFGRLERRKPRPSVSDETVAMYFSIPLRSVYTARTAKIATVVPQDVGVDFITEISLRQQTSVHETP